MFQVLALREGLALRYVKYSPSVNCVALHFTHLMLRCVRSVNRPL